MIISRTPFRLSLFGGGTDYPSWYTEHGGAVLATTIDKYCYLTCRYLPPFFDHRYRLVYSRIEHCQRIEDIAHPVVRAVLQYLGIDAGVEIHHDGDLPARSGMGSSSAFTVGLLHALCALKGEMRSRDQLARDAIHVEQGLLRETVGCQDQIITAFGGINHISFTPRGDFAVRPVTIPKTRVRALQSHLMLFYTGVERIASQVAESYVRDLNETKRRQLRLVRDLVEEAINILQGGGDLEPMGALLHEAWDAKRSLSARVSTEGIDGLYAAARRAGALGGKLVGAGGGGFMLLFVPPHRHGAVRDALHPALHVPFRFQFSGTQIIFYDPERDYAAEAAEAALEPDALPSRAVAS
jgi:D-glycero-alpha-D-manno-heptose-7-phosphate kinase